MSIAEEWLDYEQRVIPAGASATQRIRSRRDFYAGAACLVKLANVNRTLSEEEFSAEINRELTAFHDAVLAGLA